MFRGFNEFPFFHLAHERLYAISPAPAHCRQTSARKWSRRWLDRTLGRPKVEETENFGLGKAQAGRCGGLADNLVEQRTFVLEDLVDPLFDCGQREHPRNGDRSFRTDAMGPIDRLVL